MPKTVTAKTAEKYMCVRLKRYAPKKGNKLQRYTVFGMKFLEEAGWYKVHTSVVFAGKKIDLKGYLENVLQDNDDPESPFAFDVVTPAEAERINKKEEEAERRRHYNLRTNGPTDMTRKRRKDESGDLTLDDVNSKPSRRKFPRSKLRSESTADE